jgi:glucuronoarabinoxylan endo-1,4-beta-xylanase
MLKRLFLIYSALLSTLFLLKAAGQSGTATIDYASTLQRIDGFGASSAWMNAPLSAADADLIFSTNNGAGLSLLRTRIAPGGVIDDAEGTIAQQAAARGARIWSTPWSPPGAFTANGSVDGSSYVDTQANNATYAGELASYVTTMLNSYGVTLYAISVQNEPDVQQTYESCAWTGAQIHDFVPWLAAQLTTAGVGSTKIMLPEDEFWQWGLSTDTWDDTNTQPLVGILAAHNYNNSYNQAPTPLFTSNLSSSNTVAVWETEHYFGPGGGGTDDSITNGLQLAQEIHNFMTVGNANAYHYWWLLGSGNGSIVDNDAAPAKRLYVMGNYSRFVRPNFYRIGTTNTGSALVSAYKDPGSSNIVIVAANPTSSTINQSFAFTNSPAVTNMIPWVTSATLSLANQPPITITNNKFTYALSPLSVVSFVTSTPNDSFEAQNIGEGNYLVGDPTGWNSSLSNGAVDAVISPDTNGTSEPWPAIPVPGLNGTNFCQIYAYQAGGGGLVYQDTGIKYQAGYTYTLAAAFGLQVAGSFDAGSSFGLYNSALTAVATTPVATNQLTAGSFTHAAMNYTSTGNEGGNGDVIIGFYAPAATAPSYFDFDNVTLVASPSSTPFITNEPVSQSVLSGFNVTLSVGSTGQGSLGYQWYFDTNTPVAGGTNATLTLTNVRTSGTYDVVITNAYGAVTSSIATVTLTTNAPISLGNYSFEAQDIGQGNYLAGDPTSWSSSLLSGTVDAVISPGTNGTAEPWPTIPVAGLDGTNFCQIYATAAGGGGLVYQDTGIKYQAGYNYTLAAAFGLQTNQTFVTGSSFGFYNSNLIPISSKSVTTNSLASGSFKDSTMSYTGTGNEGGNGDIIVGFNVPAAASAHSYFDFDNVRLVVAAPAPPSITTPPSSKTTNVGSSVSFTVVASGTPPLGYQWYANTNTPIIAATNTALTLTNVQSSGTYDVVVTSPYGSITSSIARLTLLPDPPTTLTAIAGMNSVTISYGATSTAKFYIICRSKINGGPYTKIATTTVTKYKDVNVVAGATYYYTVMASDGLNLSTKTSQVSATPLR